MSKLVWRLKRLEQSTGIGLRNRVCPECGRLPNGRIPPDAKVKFTAGFDEPEGPDNCPRCGAQLVLRLTFDDRG